MNAKTIFEEIWKKGTPIKGKDPDIYRKDGYGNIMYKSSYGKDSMMAWEIHHIKPTSKGGDNDIKNLIPLNARFNKIKAAKYSY